MNGAFQAAGTHLLADLHGIPAGPLHDVLAIEALLRGAAEAAGARILHGHFHAFGPEQGVTGVLLLAESHISIHTWPEAGFAAVDIFMCGAARPQLALAHIEQALRPQTKQVRAVARGLA
ncbi:S-adenosylmethionine decarboxylase proenzyme [Massilia sp. Bi118]|uniref:adenosylmethionine decarboxylase n=1 Tax=Massilia sp. Bi118 TaxID=2822346 RepID=UPI001DD92BFF|nr:adenosylmethionine decarboxylase [Massilia sp. Bi118]CAH0311832.1 S-adenosylmethionine decarboxylase proenzyme [Massilia sp. Bi118]